MERNMSVSKINPLAMSITLGILSAISILTIGILTHTFLAGTPIAIAIGTVYITYSPSVLNSVIGAVFGAINGAICGYVFAYLYNFLSERF